MFRYFKVLPEVPWMVSYSRSAGPSFWDYVATPGRVAMVVTPLFENDTEISENDDNTNEDDQGQDQQNNSQHQQDQQSGQQNKNTPDSSAMSNPFQSSLETVENFSHISFYQNRLSQAVEKISTPTIIEDVQIEPENSPPLPSKVLLQHIYGHYLESHHYFHLGEAYEKLKEMPDQCLWVHLGEDKLNILGQESPENYGYKKVYNDSLANVTNFIAPLAHKYFDWQQDKDFLYLPNGGIVPLRPHNWQDKKANRAALFQVKRLPNGTWFKVASIRNQATMSTRDLAEVKKTLENWNNRIEQQGWLREQTAKKSSI